MEKKQYIQPKIKNKVLSFERNLMQQGSEQTSNPWDWNSINPRDPDDPVFVGSEDDVWDDTDY